MNTNALSSLPCREKEIEEITEYLKCGINQRSGCCLCKIKMGIVYLIYDWMLIDISGVPGTGKTATVHEAIKNLKAMKTNHSESAYDETFVQVSKKLIFFISFLSFYLSFF